MKGSGRHRYNKMAWYIHVFLVWILFNMAVFALFLNKDGSNVSR